MANAGHVKALVRLAGKEDPDPSDVEGRQLVLYTEDTSYPDKITGEKVFTRGIRLRPYKVPTVVPNSSPAPVSEEDAARAAVKARAEEARRSRMAQEAQNEPPGFMDSEDPGAEVGF